MPATHYKSFTKLIHTSAFKVEQVHGDRYSLETVQKHITKCQPCNIYGEYFGGKERDGDRERNIKWKKVIQEPYNVVEKWTRDLH